jgi:hypothetical protein
VLGYRQIRGYAIERRCCTKGSGAPVDFGILGRLA